MNMGRWERCRDVIGRDEEFQVRSLKAEKTQPLQMPESGRVLPPPSLG